MRVHVVDAPLFTLPYDTHFCRALAGAGAEVTLVGRGLRDYEQLGPQPFAFAPLFYRQADGGGRGWRTSPLRKLLKGMEHVAGMRALERMAATQRPDILHLQWFALPLIDRHFLASIGRRAGLVLTVHDSHTFHGSSNASWLQLWGDRGARSIFDHYVVHTEQTRAVLRGIGIDDGRISVLPHPPLHLAIAAGTDTKPNARPTRILFFGSIKRYKGVDILVEAGLTLAAAGVDFVIHIAGRPFEPVEELESRIAMAGAERHFRFDLRYIPDEELSRYLHAADLVVFPYRQIDASGALALAVEAEKPIVASGIGVFAELPARDCLHLVAPGKATCLADALRELIENASALDELRRRTRQLKSAMPSWDDFARRCLDAYHCLCANGAHRSGSSGSSS